MSTDQARTDIAAETATTTDVATPRSRVADQEQAQRVFTTSVMISAIRCLLTYVLFPFVLPIVGIASGVGSAIGIVASLAGIAANVWSIRRFHASGHRYRWHITAVNVGVIVLLSVLLALDLADLA